MRMSNEGIKLLKEFEGLKLKPYKCSAGVPTIGYGTTMIDGRPVTMKTLPITESQAEDYLRHDLEKFEDGVLSRVKVDLSQNQFDALVSFAYNVGLGNFGGSSLLRELNKGNYKVAADKLLDWKRAAGKIVPGLVRRRAAERALFLES